ncbi:aldo/keto reductase [Geminicoccus roseus]|uniref:aldo/keto reductase n=1 Tax=Geminicoccus roseus TaxID=404900 RepID=UPI00041E2C02|nr:aldo/keto reductase [Geminicoccus roseus]
MEQRELGKSGLKIAPLVFGTNVLGWTVDERTSFDLLDRFVDAGLNAIDTADVYSVWADGHQGGESEAIIGKWMKARGNRDRIMLATKVGMDMGGGRTGLKASYIAEEVETSLRRLQTDYIDLYFAHQDDLEVPLEETLDAFARLVEQGKVRVIGASNYEAPRLSEALAVSADKGLPRYDVLQPHYNLYDRMAYEVALEEVAVEHGLGVVTYFSLAKGFLTGKYRSEADLSQSVRGSGMAANLEARGQRILAVLDEVAAETRSSPAQVSLAWLMARPSVTAPIASATSIAQIDELIGAVELKLGADAIERLDHASMPKLLEESEKILVNE